MFIYKGFADFGFCKVEWIVFGTLRGKGVLKLDSMVKWSGWWESISVFLLKDISKFFEGIGEFPFHLPGLLGNVGGNGHLFDI